MFPPCPLSGVLSLFGSSVYNFMPSSGLIEYLKIFTYMLAFIISSCISNIIIIYIFFSGYK